MQQETLVLFISETTMREREIVNALAFTMKNNGERQMRVVQMNATLISAIDFTLKSKSHGDRLVSQTNTLLCFSVHHIRAVVFGRASSHC